MSKNPEHTKDDSNSTNRLHNDKNYQQDILKEHYKTDENGEPITQEEIDQMLKIEEEVRRRYGLDDN